MENTYYIKAVLLQKCKEEKKNGKQFKQIAADIDEEVNTFFRWRSSEINSHRINDKLVKYFNLKLVSVY